MSTLEELEGIGPVYASKLKSIGVKSTAELLHLGATPQGRKDLGVKTDIDDGLILRWVNHCDLVRVKGIGSEYSDLLEAVGVDTIPELAKRNPVNLHHKMLEVNQVKEKVRQLPSLR